MEAEENGGSANLKRQREPLSDSEDNILPPTEVTDGLKRRRLEASGQENRSPKPSSSGRLAEVKPDTPMVPSVRSRVQLLTQRRDGASVAQRCFSDPGSDGASAHDRSVREHLLSEGEFNQRMERFKAPVSQAGLTPTQSPPCPRTRSGVVSDIQLKLQSSTTPSSKHASVIRQEREQELNQLRFQPISENAWLKRSSSDSSLTQARTPAGSSSPSSWAPRSKRRVCWPPVQPWDVHGDAEMTDGSFSEASDAQKPSAVITGENSSSAQREEQELRGDAGEEVRPQKRHKASEIDEEEQRGSDQRGSDQRGSDQRGSETVVKLFFSDDPNVSELPGAGKQSSSESTFLDESREKEASRESGRDPSEVFTLDDDEILADSSCGDEIEPSTDEELKMWRYPQAGASKDQEAESSRSDLPPVVETRPEEEETRPKDEETRPEEDEIQPEEEETRPEEEETRPEEEETGLEEEETRPEEEETRPEEEETRPEEEETRPEEEETRPEEEETRPEEEETRPEEEETGLEEEETRPEEEETRPEEEETRPEEEETRPEEEETRPEEEETGPEEEETGLEEEETRPEEEETRPEEEETRPEEEETGPEEEETRPEEEETRPEEEETRPEEEETRPEEEETRPEEEETRPEEEETRPEEEETRPEEEETRPEEEETRPEEDETRPKDEDTRPEESDEESGRCFDDSGRGKSASDGDGRKADGCFEGKLSDASTATHEQKEEERFPDDDVALEKSDKCQTVGVKDVEAFIEAQTNHDGNIKGAAQLSEKVQDHASSDRCRKDQEMEQGADGRGNSKKVTFILQPELINSSTLSEMDTSGESRAETSLSDAGSSSHDETNTAELIEQMFEEVLEYAGRVEEERRKDDDTEDRDSGIVACSGGDGKPDEDEPSEEAEEENNGDEMLTFPPSGILSPLSKSVEAVVTPLRLAAAQESSPASLLQTPEEPPPAESAPLYSIDVYRTQRQNQLPSMQSVTPAVQRRAVETSTPRPSINTKDRINALNEEAGKLQTVISQTLQALSCCTDEDHGRGSLEEAEAEKLLLVSCEKRSALLAEVARLRVERNAEAVTTETDYVSQQPCRGTVSISNIQLPLKVEFVCSSHNRTGRPSHYFFVLIRYGPCNMVATALATAADAQNGDTISFPTSVTLKDIRSSFEIDVEVYSLSQSAGSSVSTDRTTSKSRVTPRKLLNTITRAGNSLTGNASGPSNTRRSSNFCLVGSHKISLASLGRSKFPLDKMKFEGKIRRLLGDEFQEKVPFLSPLEGNIYLRLHSESHSNVQHQGFLTMFELISGYGVWHRRYFVLEGCSMRYWNHPNDRETKEAEGGISLSRSPSPGVRPVKRDSCARPFTFELVSGVAQQQDQSPDTLSKCWFSADTKQERLDWMEKLNQVLLDFHTWNQTPSDTLSPNSSSSLRESIL